MSTGAPERRLQVWRERLADRRHRQHVVQLVALDRDPALDLVDPLRRRRGGQRAVTTSTLVPRTVPSPISTWPVGYAITTSTLASPTGRQ